MHIFFCKIEDETYPAESRYFLLSFLRKFTRFHDIYENFPFTRSVQQNFVQKASVHMPTNYVNNSLNSCNYFWHIYVCARIECCFGNSLNCIEFGLRENANGRLRQPSHHRAPKYTLNVMHWRQSNHITHSALYVGIHIYIQTQVVKFCCSFFASVDSGEFAEKILFGLITLRNQD